MKTTVLLLLATLSTTAFARPGPSGDERPPPHEILIENADELGLDDETIDEITAIAEANREDMRELQAAADSEDARQQLHEAGRALMDQIMALLTEEQREAARELLPPPPEHGEAPPPRR